MKLTVIVILISCLEVSATGLSQKITLTEKNVSLEKVLKQIKNQTGFDYWCETNLLKKANKLDIHVKDITLEELLNVCFKDQPLTFTIVDKTIIIGNKKVLESTEKELIGAPVPTTITISGKVTDSTGKPLKGASVKLKGTNIGTTTDDNGVFNLKVPALAGDLEISFVGYDNQLVRIKTKDYLQISLKSKETKLDDIVVVGYGKQNKSNVTGSVSTVKNEELTIAPSGGVSNLLTGKLAGLITLQNTGLPGSDGANLSIRGFDAPLIIVDGAEGSIDNLDANQIESISILKDGIGSIYGARAGNGVLIITTKRGLNQKPIITFNTSTTMQGVTKILTPPSSGQLSQMKLESYLQSGQPPAGAPFTPAQVDSFFAAKSPNYLNTDWYNYVFRKWAPQQNHNISVRGGSDKIKYYGFFGYTDQQTIIKVSGGDYQKYNLQSNVDAIITKNLTLSLDLALSYENRKFPVRGIQTGGPFWQDYFTTYPWYPATLPDPTKLAWGGIDVGSVYTTSNMDISGYSLNQNLGLHGTTSLEYNFQQFIKGLKAKAFINEYHAEVFGKGFQKPMLFYTYSPATQIYTQAASFTQNQVAEDYNRNNILTQQYSLSYDNVFNKVHRISALALYESINYHTDDFSATRYNLIDPSLDQLFIGSTTGMSNNGSSTDMGRVSYLGRLNYSFMDKYLLETIFRADASAKFPASSRWGYFPSVSLGWVVSKEKFMQDMPNLDNLKLRLSYGQSGNDGVGNFQYLAGYILSSATGLINNSGNSLPAIYSSGIANPMLTWETMNIYNAGLDFSLFNKGIYGTAEVFYRKNTGIPATQATSLPSSFGATLPQENLNSLDNRGFELRVGSSKTKNHFFYDISGNISWSRAKWIHYEEPAYTDPDQKRLYQGSGRWTDRVIGYQAEGLFKSKAEINALPYTYASLGSNSLLNPGDVKYKNLNGDSILNWRDQTEIGKGTMPHWMYGFQGTLKYKNFDMTFLFQGAFGFTTYLNLTTYYSSQEYNERWTEQNNNTNALVPRLGGASSNSYTSSYYYRPNSYIRLKTASIGYSLPENILKKAGFIRARLYCSGTNLFTLSALNKYKVDPEIPSGTMMYYPQQRTISFGLNLSF